MVTMPASAMQPDAGHKAPAKASFTDSGPREPYVVVLERASAALYEGDEPGLQGIPRRSNGRIDLRSSQALDYVANLEAEQASFLHSIAAEIGREPTVLDSFQHAINAVVVELGGNEARALQGRPGVKLVEPFKLMEQDTDLGPTLIEAADVWAGAGTANGLSTRGEGIVIGVIDSGINFASPSFAQVEPVGGYVFVNPLGPNVRLGICQMGQIDDGNCNEKLIGAYDFVYNAVCTPGSPGTDPCRLPASGGTITEEPSAVDNNGHGTHTASTAGGNAVNATFNGAIIPASGVAPHANIVAYDVCYTRNVDGLGLCPNVSAIAAVNQAVADGVVDVLNYSIGGGASPWTDAVSLAFLGAHNAGVFVSASAGNSGPGAGTLGHVEPWTMTLAASTHQRSGYITQIDIDAPPNLPGGPQDVRADLGGAGTDPVGDIDAPLVLSPGYAADVNVANDGCLTGGPPPTISPYAPGQFTGQVVIIRRGGCSFSEKSLNAQNAGAVAVLIANNANAVILPGATVGITVSIPVWGLNQVDALPIREYILGDPSLPTQVHIPNQLTAVPSVPDVMANFSSKGPSFFDLLKPDITGPGVSILAAYAGPATSYELLQGTSMSTPHNTGSVALLRALQPSWTPAQIKSALMMTASTTNLLKENGVTPSDPWDRGAGRIAVREATKVGLVMNETGTNFSAADPALGGSPSSLNLPSIAHQACLGTCNFTRSFRSTVNSVVTWDVSVTGAIAPAVSVPASFVIGTGDTRSIQVQVDSTQLTPAAYTFGEIVLTPSLGGLPALHLPLAIRAAAPEIEVTPTSLTATAVINTTATENLSIANLGNPTLNWSLVAGSQPGTLLNLPSTSSGQRAQQYLSFGNIGEYVAEDFLVPANVGITSFQANGFVLPSSSALGNPGGVARGLTVLVYADDNGQPAGVPEIVDSPPPLWTVSRTFGGVGVPTAGITLTGNNITLDLAAAGAPALNLTPGRYWFSVLPHLNGNGSGASAANALWAWRSSGAQGEGGAPVATFPGLGDTDWALTGDAGMSSIVIANVTCGVPWASADITSDGLGIGGSSNIVVTFDATGLTPGEYRGALCVQANDSNEALTVIPLEFTVDGVQTDPSMTVDATPPTLSITEQTLIEATVTPGAFPTSTGIDVTADLSEIGGSATQPLNDAAIDGDLVAADGIYSFAATVAANTSSGNKNVPVSMVDAQGRTANDAVMLSINATDAPAGMGVATPANTYAGGSSLLTVAVTPGANPTSTGITVTADLSSIGGSATQAFFDDGSNGDLVGGDGTWSYAATVAGNTTAGLKNLDATVGDAQSRSSSANIELTIDAITAISGIGAAAPPTVARGGNTLLTVDVVEGTNPPSTGVTVSVDLSSIGSGSVVTMFDDGSNGDAVGGDGIFSRTVLVAPDTTPGAKTLTASIADNQGRADTADIEITVSTSMAPTATGLATPSSVGIGGTSLLTVTVVPGSSPASTGIAVMVNLSSIGGSANQLFFDDASNGDLIADDNVFSYSATVAAGTTLDVKSLPVSVVDAQLRSSNTDIALTIAGEQIFGDGFED